MQMVKKELDNCEDLSNEMINCLNNNWSPSDCQEVYIKLQECQKKQLTLCEKKHKMNLLI